jgi:TRAP-type C4-dicarboxylate transport system permease small subunit
MRQADYLRGEVMDKLIEFLFDGLLTLVLKIVGIVLVLTVLLQIYSRIGMTAPYSWTEELSRFSFIWFCFLGSCYTLRKDLHLGIDYYYDKMPLKVQKAVSVIISLLVLIFGLMLFVYGLKMMQITSFQKSPILRLNMSNMYAVLPTTGFFFTIHSIHKLIKQFKTAK